MSWFMVEMTRLADEVEAEHGLEGLAGDLVVGLRRQSALILDNLGMTVSIASLPGHQALEETRDAAYRGFWARNIRPWLFPRRHAALTQIYDGARRQIQQELLNRIIEEGKAMLDGQ